MRHIIMVTVAVVGEGTTRRFDLSELAARFRTHHATYRIHCASSGLSESEWRCIPLLDLLTAAGVPERATHIVAEAADGYRAPIEMHTAYHGVLGIKRVDADSAGADHGPPRILASDIASERAVQAVRTIDWIAAAPDEDVEAYASW